MVKNHEKNGPHIGKDIGKNGCGGKANKKPINRIQEMKVK